MERVKQELEDIGVSVLPDVIPEKDCDAYVAQLQQWLQGFGDGFPKNINSIIHGYSIAHH